MARCEYDGFERVDGQLIRLNRDMMREVVMAGAAACVEETKKNRNIPWGTLRFFATCVVCKSYLRRPRALTMAR